MIEKHIIMLYTFEHLLNKNLRHAVMNIKSE